MIVRIMGEGQYRIPDDMLDEINEVDNRLVEIVERGAEREFALVYHDLIDRIRTSCPPVSLDELIESDLVLPPNDISLEEAREIFQGQGILPG